MPSTKKFKKTTNRKLLSLIISPEKKRKKLTLPIGKERLGDMTDRHFDRAFDRAFDWSCEARKERSPFGN